MAELFEFTFNGAYLKAVVNAYRQISDSFVFHFTRDDVSTSVMGRDGVRAIQIILTPLDYRAYPDEAWVRGDMDLLWGAVRNLKKTDTVKVRVEDDKLYVGTIQPGAVVPEGEVFEEERFKPPEEVERGFLQVVASGFKKILRSAPPDTRYVGFDVDAPGGHIVLGESVMDLGEPQEWLLAVDGKAREAYTLDLFIPLMVSGLTEDTIIRITEKGIVIIEYAEAQSTVRFYMAPVTGGAEMIAGIVEKPKPVRTLILRMGASEAAALFKVVKAIDYLIEHDEVTFDAADGLGLFWRVGYLKVPPPYLEEWIPPPEPFQGSFILAELVKHLKGVVDLRLYYDAEKRLVLWGTGPDTAPMELTADPVPVKVEAPKVEGKVIFKGPVDLLLRTVDDAEAAGDEYLVFYTSPYEIEAFGRNAVYYEATFELDDFQVVEEDYVPIGSDAFGYLIGFLRNVPAEWCGMGKATDDRVYLSCETGVGEFRAIRSTYNIEEAVKAYEERVKRPVAPPEVEELPVAPPLPVERVTVYMLLDYPEFVGVDGRSYGPYRAGEAAWVPRQDAEELVVKGWASWEKPTPSAVAPPTPLPEESSLGDLYLKYYAEALARHRAEIAAEEAEEPEAVEEVPAEVHVEEATLAPKEEPSLGDLYVKYYKEALARHTEKT